MWKCSCGQRNFPPQEEKLYFSLPFTHEKKQNISTFSRNSRKNLSHWFYTGKEKLLEFLQVLRFIGNILQGICFSLSFKHWTFLSSWFFPFCLENMLSVMIKWKKIIIIVWKCSLRKEKKRFHVWNWMQVYSPDLFFFLNLYFINE